MDTDMNRGNDRDMDLDQYVHGHQNSVSHRQANSEPISSLFPRVL
jgi:hypothetical protein